MKVFKKLRDTVVLEKIKRGDTEAFAEVYDEYHQKIYRYIFFKVPSSEIAEDLTGQVFLKFWEHIRVAEKKVENLQAFLYSIAHNLVIDYYRTRKQDVDISAMSEAADESHEDIISQVEDSGDLEKVRQGLVKLSDEYNEIITLHYVEDYSIKEIAHLLGKTENNIRVTLHRALKSLRNEVGDKDL
jgi:RNA polymerase sigma-70 factor, ECF subfamily